MNGKVYHIMILLFIFKNDFNKKRNMKDPKTMYDLDGKFSVELAKELKKIEESKANEDVKIYKDQHNQNIDDNFNIGFL